MLNTKPIKKENYEDYVYNNNYKHSDSTSESKSHNKHNKHKKHDSSSSSSNRHHKHDKSHSSHSNKDENNKQRQENRYNEPLFKLENNYNKSETPNNYKNNISNVIERKNSIGGGNDNINNNVITNNDFNKINETINISNGIHRIEYNKELDTYSIYENNQLDCTFVFNDILRYIFNSDESSYPIKKYIFIITINIQQGVNEFNFVNSVFTSNLDCMIKLQNYM
jgi:hypothetical protein